mgnify:CR=1 FL=1
MFIRSRRTLVASAVAGLACLAAALPAAAQNYPTRPITTIIGSDIAHAVPLTLVAGLGHASLGTVDYGLRGTLLVGSIPGIWIGSHLSLKLAEHWVRMALALILIFVGLKLVFH